MNADRYMYKHFPQSVIYNDKSGTSPNVQK